MQSYNGHLGTPHNNETYDTNGACVQPSPTPTVAPTTTPTPTPSGCEEDCITPTITPTPTPTEMITPTPPQVSGNMGGFTEADHNQSKQAPDCPNLTPTQVNDVWYTNYQINGDTASIDLHWGVNDNYPSVNIAYGENKGEWRYGVQHIDNNGQFTIGGLKPHQTYWFQVAYVLGCSTGDYSSPVDP